MRVSPFPDFPAWLRDDLSRLGDLDDPRVRQTSGVGDLADGTACGDGGTDRVVTLAARRGRLGGGPANPDKRIHLPSRGEVAVLGRDGDDLERPAEADGSVLGFGERDSKCAATVEAGLRLQPDRPVIVVGVLRVDDGESVHVVGVPADDLDGFGVEVDADIAGGALHYVPPFGSDTGNLAYREGFVK